MVTIKLTLRKLQAIIFNLNPNWVHYSNCKRCNRKWSYVEGHSTPYKEGCSLFPLCQDCWGDLTPDERLPYYRELWLSWAKEAIMIRKNSIAGIIKENYSCYRTTNWKPIEQAVLKGL